MTSGFKLPTLFGAGRLSRKARLAILDEALDWILETPENWNQGSYVCRTGMCVAGHIAYLSPYHFEILNGEPHDNLLDRLGRGMTDADTYASKVLDLDDEDPDIFGYDNTIIDLFNHRNEYAARRGLPQRELPDQETLDRAQAIAHGANLARGTWDLPLDKDDATDILRDRYELSGQFLQLAWDAYKTEAARQVALRQERPDA